MERTEKPPGSYVRGTLCAYCAKATNAGCRWSDTFDPVPGWRAARTLNSYVVYDCPEYLSDRYMNRDPDKLDTEGCIDLLQAMMTQLKDDYMDMPAMRRQIEAFIMNPFVSKLFFFCVPRDLVLRLRKEAKKHDERKKLKP